MKKALRYWWVVVAGMVVLPAAFVLSSVPRGSGWVTEYSWQFNELHFGTEKSPGDGGFDTAEYSNIYIGPLYILSGRHSATK